MFGNLLFNRHFINMMFDELVDLAGYSKANLSKLLNTAYLKVALWIADEFDFIFSVELVEMSRYTVNKLYSILVTSDN